jgi:uncharacterized protein
MAQLKRILSLDGGGIRGILSGTVLEVLEEKLNAAYVTKHGTVPDRPIRLAQYFDMMSGTSTGGILSCLFLCPSEDDPTYPRFSAKEAVNMYFQKGGDIFTPTFLGRLPGVLGSLNGAKFGALSLENTLKDYLKELKLSELLRPCLITTYDIEKRKAVFFTSHDAKNDPAKDFPMWHVARSTSAAPTFFPPAYAESVEKEAFYNVDGGLFANNPTMCAYVEAMKIFRSADGTLFSPQRLMVLSIGTGEVKKPYGFNKAESWGTIGWLKPILDILMSGVSETIDYQMKKLFQSVDCPEQYTRIMPELGEADEEMDNVSEKNLNALRAAGLATAKNYDAVLEKIAADLIENA